MSTVWRSVWHQYCIHAKLGGNLTSIDAVPKLLLPAAYNTRLKWTMPIQPWKARRRDSHSGQKKYCLELQSELLARSSFFVWAITGQASNGPAVLDGCKNFKDVLHTVQRLCY